MNKMFKLIEQELQEQGKTKVWFANQLNESTQNINNWKVRGVPPAKVKGIADVLGVSREYLEGDSPIRFQAVASTRGDYRVESVHSADKHNYDVHITPGEQSIESLLGDHLQVINDLNFVRCSAWKHVDPFLEIDIWIGKDSKPERVYLPIDRIVAITDCSQE
ncbi:MAG: hypothetical protein AAF431_09995 [Pseudomonadota bacterium]